MMSRALGIRRTPELNDIFSAKLLQEPHDKRDCYAAGWKKVKGLAIPKTRQIYTPSLESSERERFRDAHEIIHIECPWHYLSDGDIYIENEKTLSPKARRRFEVEANYGGSRLLFPLASWIADANSGTCDFNSINALSVRYGVSKRATFRNFVEVQQSACVGISYLPNDYLKAEDGFCSLHKPVIFRSRQFEDLYRGWKPPLKALKCWRQAMINDLLSCGENSDENEMIFRWHAFWNSYELMVLMEPSV